MRTPPHAGHPGPAPTWPHAGHPRPMCLFSRWAHFVFQPRSALPLGPLALPGCATRPRERRSTKGEVHSKCALARRTPRSDSTATWRKGACARAMTDGSCHGHTRVPCAQDTIRNISYSHLHISVANPPHVRWIRFHKSDNIVRFWIGIQGNHFSSDATYQHTLNTHNDAHRGRTQPPYQHHDTRHTPEMHLREMIVNNTNNENNETNQQFSP